MEESLIDDGLRGATSRVYSTIQGFGPSIGYIVLYRVLCTLLPISSPGGTRFSGPSSTA